MGTLIHRKSGHWYARVYQTINGKQYRPAATFKTEIEAKAWMLRMEVGFNAAWPGDKCPGCERDWPQSERKAGALVLRDGCRVCGRYWPKSEWGGQ